VGGVRSWSPKWRFTYGKQKTYTAENMKKLEATGVCFLDDTYTVIDGIAYGGLGSGLINDDRAPKLDMLSEFFSLDMPKVLLCHHPEYYKKYLIDKDIDLIVSGHAHGGQWRFFGRGVFAPGQGLFPKYTSGVHDGRLVISRGMKKGRRIPRIFNPPEIVKIVVENK
jgi:predicted MPP superfamily phosphohydrolase